MALSNAILTRYRWVMLGLALLLVPAGYSVRFADGVPEWLRNIGGNVAYEMFWICGFAAVFPALWPRGIAGVVCLVTFGLEFLQLSQHPILVAARSSLPGRLVLGNGFTWVDFPQYVLGSVIGWAIVSWIRQKILRSPSSPIPIVSDPHRH